VGANLDTRLSVSRWRSRQKVDTAGYSELIFSLFDLVGLQFSPRIRDMADQRLYRINRSVRYQHIEPLFSGTLNQELILRRWDDLLRVAGSVKMGWVTASLLIGKLQSYRRQNALMRALQEYGRLIKTIHIVRCLDSPEYRRSISRQLNKGEQLHNLRRFLFSPTKAKFAALSTETRRRRCSA
jgi:TnpA family transposase